MFHAFSFILMTLVLALRAFGKSKAQLALENLALRQQLASMHRTTRQARVGKRAWHIESGYSKRSKVETTFHRYKGIVGSVMKARGLAAQRVEARIGCKILNTMTALGMPDGEMQKVTSSVALCRWAL